MNTSLVIIVSDKTIGIGTTIISGIGTDLSWIPSDVHAVHWNGSSGEIEYNDGKANLGITSIGIYSQAETSFNNEIQRQKDLGDASVSQSSFLWEKLRNERDNLLLFSDFTQFTFETSKMSDIKIDIYSIGGKKYFHFKKITPQKDLIL